MKLLIRSAAVAAVAVTAAAAAGGVVGAAVGSSKAKTTTTTTTTKPKAPKAKTPSTQLSGTYVFTGEIDQISDYGYVPPGYPGCGTMQIASPSNLTVHGKGVTFSIGTKEYTGTLAYLNLPVKGNNGYSEVPGFTIKYSSVAIGQSSGTPGSLMVELVGIREANNTLNGIINGGHDSSGDAIGGSSISGVTAQGAAWSCTFNWSSVGVPPQSSLPPNKTPRKPSKCLTSSGFATISCLDAAVQAAARAGTSPGIVQGGIPDDVATCKPANANLSNGSYVACELLSPTVGGAQEIVQIHSPVPPGFTSVGIGSSLNCSGLNAGEQAAFSAGGWQCVAAPPPPPTTAPTTPITGTTGNTGCASASGIPGNNGVDGVCVGRPLNN